MPQVNTSNVSAGWKEIIHKLNSLEQFFRDKMRTPTAPVAQVHFGSKLDQISEYAIKSKCDINLDNEDSKM